MVAGVPEGFFTGLYPQVAHQVWVSLNGVSLVVIVGRVDQFGPEVVPH